MDEIKIIRSNRKSISLQVDENCRIIVRAPIWCTRRKIDKFINEKQDWLSKALEKQQRRAEKLSDLDEAKIKELKKYALEYLPERLDYYSKIMNVSYTGFKVTSARKRFGSCSGNNSLCFSYMLMLYPKEAIDYVVVHELAHIRYKNHQKEFYDFISTVLPDYKEREKLLKM